MLALDANQKRRVLDLMDAITLRPEATFDNMSHYLGIISARTRLKLAETDDALRDEVSYLWDIALGIEEGDLSAAEKRLRQAQQALKDALKNVEVVGPADLSFFERLKQSGRFSRREMKQIRALPDYKTFINPTFVAEMMKAS